MVSGVAGARTLGLSYPVSLMLQAALSVPVLALAAWAVTRTSDPRTRAFVLVTAVPLVTPYAFNYDLTALAAVLVWRLCRPLPADGFRALTLLLAWIIPAAAMYLNVWGFAVGPFGLMAVFAWSVSEAFAARAGLERRATPRPLAA